MLYLIICIFLYEVHAVSGGVAHSRWTRSSTVSTSAGALRTANQCDVGTAGPTALSKSYSPDQPLAPFLHCGLLFYPQSLELTPASEECLRVDAGWVKGHPKVRIVTVGFCDTLGSETCTHELAEKRGAVVKEILLNDGVDSWQVVAVKGWDQAAPTCEAVTPRCQEMNRRARIFVASSNYVH
jgi:outer membrane protein OmpA-like peptidoglycan-associated protein